MNMVNSWTCLRREFNALFTSRRLIKAGCSFANDAEHLERYSNYLYCKRLKTNRKGSVGFVCPCASVWVRVCLCVQFSVSLKWFRDDFISVHRYGFLWNTKLHNRICNSEVVIIQNHPQHAHTHWKWDSGKLNFLQDYQPTSYFKSLYIVGVIQC